MKVGANPALNLAPFGRWTLRYKAALVSSELTMHTKCSNLELCSPHREAIKYRLDGSPWIVPEKRRKKAIRTENCLSEASFPFRFFLSIAGSGQSSGSPSFGYFSWRSKRKLLAFRRNEALR
jgi:hypothetical protein